MEAVGAGLAFDRNSALFKRPSLTERELCQFSGALCYVKQAKICSACLCSAVLESGPWAISASIVLRVRKGDSVTVCMSVNDCSCFLISYLYALSSTTSPYYLVFSLIQMQTSTHANPLSDNRNSD